MRANRQHRLTLQLRIVIATAVTVLVTTAMLTIGFHFLLARTLNSDANRVLAERTDAGIASLNYRAGHIYAEGNRAVSTLDQNIWIYQDGKPIDEGVGKPAVVAAADALANVTSKTTIIVPSEQTRLRADPYIVDGVQRGVVVAALSLVPYDHTLDIATITLAVLGLLATIGCTVLAAVLIKIALRPVALMTRQAADWSEHDVDRRFDIGPTRDEISGLANTLDRLLDRLSASLHHEQRFSSEMAHELRTPLAVLMSETGIAIKHTASIPEAIDAFETIHQQAIRMGEVIDTLMAIAERQSDLGQVACELGQAVNDALTDIKQAALHKGVAFTVDVSEAPITVGLEAAMVARIINPIVDNAVKYARDMVIVMVDRSENAAIVAVSNDGPPIVCARPEDVFQPGFRADPQPESRGAGLGLALSRRIARSVGGDVTLAAGPNVRFMVTLPLG